MHLVTRSRPRQHWHINGLGSLAPPSSDTRSNIRISDCLGTTSAGWGASIARCARGRAAHLAVPSERRQAGKGLFGLFCFVYSRCRRSLAVLSLGRSGRLPLLICLCQKTFGLLPQPKKPTPRCPARSVVVLCLCYVVVTGIAVGVCLGLGSVKYFLSSVAFLLFCGYR